MSRPILSRLIEVTDRGRVVTDPERLTDYSHDEGPETPRLPDALVRVRSPEEIAAILRLAAEERIPVTPRGLGTGLAGGSVPVQGGIVISLELMDQIVEVDTANLMVRTQPGVRTVVLQNTCLEHGLYYPVDPASLDDCSIGGNVATNAGGARAFKYGVTGDYVRGVEAVLADGSIISSGGKIRKNVTGYDLTRLLVGSEGTLGIITGVTFRLVPRPRSQIDLLFPFDRLSQGVELVLRLVHDRRLLPSVVEFIERKGIAACNRVLEDSLPFADAEIQVLVELEGNDREQVLEEALRLGEIAQRLGGREPLIADNPASQARLWTARRSLAKTLKRLYPEVRAEDIVVPLVELPQTVEFIAELERRHGVTVVPFGHIGDGNIHVDICRTTADRQSWQRACRQVEDELVEFVLAHGGQVTAEHGIGSLKLRFMKRAVGPAELELMRRLKRTLDPENILNPGKILPED